MKKKITYEIVLLPNHKVKNFKYFNKTITTINKIIFKEQAAFKREREKK
jgi:hypothetical protein